MCLKVSLHQRGVSLEHYNKLVGLFYEQVQPLLESIASLNDSIGDVPNFPIIDDVCLLLDVIY